MIMFLIVIALIITAFTAAYPILERDDSDSTSAITLTAVTTTVSLAGSPTDYPIVWNDDEEPIYHMNKYHHDSRNHFIGL
jgi:hypothetical protein